MFFGSKHSEYKQITADKWVQWEWKDTSYDISFVERDHMSWTKLSHEPRTTMIVEVSVHKKASWLNIHTEEIKTTKNSVQRSIVHNISLPEEAARKVYEALHARFGDQSSPLK